MNTIKLLTGIKGKGAQLACGSGDEEDKGKGGCEGGEGSAAGEAAGVGLKLEANI